MALDNAVEQFESLTDSEKQKILRVLERDAELQKAELEKLGALRQEIRLLRVQSGLSLHDKTDLTKHSSRTCYRCGVALGLIFNVGSVCAKCNQKVCADCRRLNGSKSLCILCFKNREYSAITGEWFFVRNRKSQKENDYVPTNLSSDSNVDTSSSSQQYFTISNVLLKEIQKAERRRQVQAIDTSDQLVVVARDKYEAKLRNNKQNNKLSKKENSTTNDKHRKTWNSNNFADAVLSLMNRRNSKNRPFSLPPCDDDDESGHIQTLDTCPIPEVKVDSDNNFVDPNNTRYGDAVTKSGTVHETSLLKCPSVPVISNMKSEAVTRGGSFKGYANFCMRKVVLVPGPKISEHYFVVNGVAVLQQNETHGVYLEQDGPFSLIENAMAKTPSDYADQNITIFKKVNVGGMGSRNLLAPADANTSSKSVSTASSRETLNMDESRSMSGDSQGHYRAQSILSLTSLYSNAGELHAGKIDIKGRILLSLEYDCRSAVMEIHVRQCEDLAAVDPKRNRSNPYVKTYLLPDRSASGKRKTKIKRHTLNPTFDETLKYSGFTKSDLEGRILHVSVWHNDAFGRNDFLGETRIQLSDYPWGNSVYGYWYELEPKKENDDSVSTNSYRGEISISIKFVSPNLAQGKRYGSFHCLVRDARHLQSVRSSGVADPFVKAYMHPITSKSTKQKSTVVKHDLNPVWNCSFDYEGETLDCLKESSLELTIWDHQRFAANEFLGGVRLNLGSGLCKNVSTDWMDAQDKERTVWRQMLDRPNFWCDATIPLRSSMK